MVEALQSDHQPVLSGHKLVLQLSHVGLVGRLGQVVSQDVHEDVKQNQTERGTTRVKPGQRGPTCPLWSPREDTSLNY